MRLMAGAPPAKTQQLLERCLSIIQSDQSDERKYEKIPRQTVEENMIDIFLQRSCGRASHGGPGLVCGKERALYSGEREHAEALVST